MSDDVNWRKLDEILRDPEVEGKRFIAEDELPAIRESWEEEVKSQAESMAQTVYESWFGGRYWYHASERARRDIMDGIQEGFDAVFGPEEGEGHTCDLERPCEPNDHLCRNRQPDLRCPNCGGPPVESEASHFVQMAKYPGAPLGPLGDPRPAAATHRCANDHSWTTTIAGR